MSKFRLPYFLLTLLFVLIAENSNCSTLKGKITNYDTNEPIPFVNVYIKSEKIGCQSDEEGKFIFENINPGIHKVNIEGVGYNSQYDSLNFKNNDSIIEKEYNLQTITVKYKVNLTKEENEYFDDLKETAKGKPIIEFVIDSLTYEQRFVFFYSTFTNNTPFPVYILEEKECIRPFTFQIRNEESEILKQNSYSLSCDTRFFYNPNSEDLIEIPPNSTINYPRTEFWLYDFSQYPAGVYEVQISYEHINPLQLKSFRVDNENYEEVLKDEIAVAKKSLRGSYTSQNLLKFENK